MKTIMAYTYEIDDAEVAVDEILSQLNNLKDLQKNTIGILTCYSEFVESGVVELLFNSVTFPIVGTTTYGMAINGQVGQLMLGLMVLTGDDIEFETIVTDSLKDDVKGPITKAYKKPDIKPKLLFTFAPLLFNCAGDDYVEAINEVSGGVPNFGTITVDNTADYSKCGIIYNNEFYRDRLVMVRLTGNINPKFFVTSISEKNIMKQTAIISKANGNVLQEVNGLPLAAYLETLGLASNGKIAEGVNSIPFIIDYRDGTQPIARALFAITPDGYGVCGGIMPVGSTLSIGALDKEEVLNTTSKTLKDIKNNFKKETWFMFSCIGRNLALGVDILAELECATKELQGHGNYFLSYSGGEIGPVYNQNEGIKNSFHNNTFIVCIF